MLIIDENYFNLYAMQSMFEQLDAHVEVAMDCTLALQKISEHLIIFKKSYDLIMIDFDANFD